MKLTTQASLHSLIEDTIQRIRLGRGYWRLIRRQPPGVVGRTAPPQPRKVQANQNRKWLRNRDCLHTRAEMWLSISVT